MISFTGLYLALIGSIFGALSMLFLKVSMLRKKLMKNLILIALIFGAGLIFGVLALRFGNLSIIYPITSLVYVWTVLLSKYILKEKVKTKEILGVISIILGIILIVS
jgi:uncharacterized membrane protein